MRMDRELIFICLLSFVSLSTEKLDNVKICAVADPKAKPGHVTKFCDRLAKSKKTPVTCVYGNDRLHCLRMVSNRDADFTVLNPEDLYSSTLWYGSDVLVVGEMRAIRNMPYVYGNVVVVRNSLNVDGVDLRGKKLCHPGLKSGSKWNDLFAQYLEERLAPRNCEPDITVFEDRAKTSSNFFGNSCKAGPWTEDKEEDRRMKLDYFKMCSICELGDCSNSEKYRGTGSLMCLTDGIGDVLWARYDDVKTYFKKVGYYGNISPLDYSFLCEDGTLRTLDVSDPCIWLAMPWQVVAANRKSTNEVQKIFHDFGNGEWEENLVQVIESYLHFIVNLEVPKTPEDFLKGVPGYLSAIETSQGNCKPKHTVRLCTTSAIEQRKCVWASRAALSVALQPTLECVEQPNITFCLESVANGTSDVVVVPPDYAMDATTKYALTILFYELPYQDRDGYLSTVVVRGDSNAKTVSDLKYKRACFTRVNGVGWNSALDRLKREGRISSSCSGKESLLGFFGDLCVIRNDGREDVTVCCNGTLPSGSDEAKEVDCLLAGGCDVAFLDDHTVEAVGVEKLKRICLSGNCTWYWTYPSFLMINSHINSVRFQEVSSLFSQMGEVFGRKSKNDNKIFELFATFDGVENVLFKDTSVNFAKIGSRIPGSEKNDYEEIMFDLTTCSARSTVYLHRFLVIAFVIYVIVIY